MRKGTRNSVIAAIAIAIAAAGYAGFKARRSRASPAPRRRPALARAGARRRAGGVGPHRSEKLQPLRAARFDDRSGHHADARQAGPPEPGHAGDRSLARRIVDARRRRPQLHADAAAGRHLLRRPPVHRRRCAVFARGGVRRAGGQRDRRHADGRRQAAAGRRARSADRGGDVPGAVRARPAHPRQPADVSQAPARRGAEERHLRSRLGRRHACPIRSPASVRSSSPSYAPGQRRGVRRAIPATGGGRPTATRCPISTA